GLDNRRCILLGDDGGAVDRVARSQIAAVMDSCNAESPLRVDAIRLEGEEWTGAVGEDRRFLGCRSRSADRFDGGRLNDQRLAGHQKAILPSIALFEFGDDAIDAWRRRELERRIGAFVLDMQRAGAIDAGAVNALPQNF